MKSGTWEEFLEAGSEPSFRKLYDEYYRYLSLIGTKRGFSVEKTEDAINDLFLYLWENRSMLMNIRNPHSYIITSFLHSVYRMNRSMYEEVWPEESLDDLFTSPSVEELFIHQHMDSSAHLILQQHIASLPDKQRGILVQKFYAGLSYAEIATANNVSVNTVYNTVYKTLSKLKSAITPEQEIYLSFALRVTSSFFAFFFLIG